jgi:rubrerythrin
LTDIEDIIDKSADELANIEGMGADRARELLETLSESIEVVEEEVVKPETAAPQESAPAAGEEEAEEVEYYECPNCGSRIEETMNQCPSCGVELVFKEEDEE